SIPAIVFLISVLIVVPIFYRSYFGGTFDYLGNVFAYGVGALGAKSIFVGPHGTFGWPVIWQNFSNFFGLVTMPVQISPFTNMAPDNLNLAQVNNMPQLLGMAGFFAVIVGCAFTHSQAAGWLRRTLLTTFAFVVLMTLLSI